MDKISFNIIMRNHTRNLVRFFNISHSVLYENEYIELKDDYSEFYHLMNKIDFELKFISYQSFYPNINQTLYFIKKLGKTIYIKLLGEELYNDIIKELNKDDSKGMTFDERYK